MLVSAEPEGYTACCEALADWDPGDELAAIRAPTLVRAIFQSGTFIEG
jgi:3-oxoadipate enol-lactonase/4-carboxymuconolactone decarboxylase